MEHWSETRPLYEGDSEENIEQIGQTYVVTIKSEDIDYLNFAKTRRYGQEPDFRVSVPALIDPYEFIQEKETQTIDGATVCENGNLRQLDNPELTDNALSTSESSYKSEEVIDVLIEESEVDLSWFHNGELPPEITIHLTELNEQNTQTVEEELTDYGFNVSQELQLAREQVENHSFDWYEEAKTTFENL